MKERIKNFRFDHGQKTYQMAWLVEFCLFAIALSLAGFNLLFGIQDGDIVSGLFLAVGWGILALIELSIIPMAGSFRLAKRWNKLFASLGLIGLLLLSSFTVYEFNEIASEYMTRGAREAAILVNKKENDIQEIKNQIIDLENHQRNISITRSNLLSEKERATEREYQRYQAEVQKAEQYYANRLIEFYKSFKIPTFETDEERQLEQIDNQINDYQNEITLLRRQRKALFIEQTITLNARIAPKLQQLESRLKRIKETIDTLKSDKEFRIQQAKSGLFQTKEELIQSIQDEFKEKSRALQEEEITVESEIAELRIPAAPPKKTIEIDDKIRQISKLIELQIARRESINQKVSARLESDAFKNLTAQRATQNNQLIEAQQEKSSQNLARHNVELESIQKKYASKIQSLDTEQSSTLKVISSKQDLEKSIIQLKTEMIQVIETASSKYEKTMYFRMASWFMKDAGSTFGNLPQKADYNKSLRYIFAPIGLFFGIIAVLLAYLGTSLMIEASQTSNPNVDYKKLTQENTLLKDRLTDYEQLKRKLAEAINTKSLAVTDVSRRLNEKLHLAESQLLNQSALIEKLNHTQNDLEIEKDKRQKISQKLATAIDAVPDSIVVLNTLKDTIERNESDLANAKKLLYDSLPDPTDRAFKG